MNSWQAFNQLVAILRASVWTGSETVFARESVMVTGDVAPEMFGRVRLPCALIRVGDAPADPEHDEEPDLIVQAFEVSMAVAVANDPFGQAAFLGAARVPLKSAGKGILEVEEKLFEAIKSLGDSHGVRIMERGKGAAMGTAREGDYLAFRNYRFEATVTAAKSYPAPRKFAGTGGSGQVAMTWTRAPSRWDYYTQVLVYKSGATAPTSIMDGTVASGVTASSTSKTVTGLAAGVWSFSLFATYDEYAATPAASSQSSPPVSLTKTVT